MAVNPIRLRRFDFIVVGSGAAGCAAAAAIVRRNPSASVALLEMGCGEESPLASKVPFGRAVLPWSIQSRKFLTNYVSQPEPGLGNRILTHTRGTCLGGNSQFDTTWYLRGTAIEYAGWNQPEWTFDKVLPLYKKLERSTFVDDDEFHGVSGPLVVSGPPSVSLNLTLNVQFAHACEAGAIAPRPDVNAGLNAGCFVYPKLIESGLRHDIFRHLIVPSIRTSSSLHVHSGVKVEKLLLDESGLRVTGVCAITNGTRVELEAPVVILTAGSIENPLLLQRSGIGSATLLAQHGIATRLNNPHVGENLIEATSIDVVYDARIPHSIRHKNMSLRNICYMFQQWREWSDVQTGQLASLEEVGAYIRSKEAADSPDLHLTMRCMQWIDRGRTFAPYNGFTLTAEHCHPTSRGKVQLGGSDHNAKPFVVGNHLSTQEDIEGLSEGLNFIRRLVDAEQLLKHEYFEGPFGLISPLQSYRPKERLPSHEITDRELLVQHARGNGELFGTCSMGKVVDEKLEVLGVRGLYVADASVVPVPMAATATTLGLAVGTRCGESFS